MLRITLISHSAEEAVLRLEGWLAEEDVAVLMKEGLRQLTATQQLALNLAEVRFIDAAGLALLQSWSGQRLRLLHPSSYLRTVLEAAGLEIDEG